MSNVVSSLPGETVERIQAALRASPSQMTLQLARKLAVPEVEVIRHMPDDYSVELDASRWEEVFTALPEFGKVHVIVSNESVTCEVVGKFGGFSTWGEFFNVQSGTLDMHIRHGQIGAIFAVEKPSHVDGIRTLSFQFFDQRGHSMLKVFAAFGGSPTPPERVALFEQIRDRFRPH
jgi:putative heme utilization carrier protein HutX